MRTKIEKKKSTRYYFNSHISVSTNIISTGVKKGRVVANVFIFLVGILMNIYFPSLSEKCLKETQFG